MNKVVMVVVGGVLIGGTVGFFYGMAGILPMVLGMVWGNIVGNLR